MLTLEQLNKIEAGIFKTGLTIDNYTGINMSNTDKLLRWAAVKGHGYNDWCIYIGDAQFSEEEIKLTGDKITSPTDIQKLVPTNKEALSRYRY